MLGSRERVLVTGASGFVGIHAVRALLDRSAEVCVLGRRPFAGTAFHRCDLLSDDIGAIVDEVRPTHLLHLAWNDDRKTIFHGMQSLDWAAASLRLVSAFHRAGGRRAVIAGSCAEYDWTHPLLDERITPLKPQNPYATAKKAVADILFGTPSLAPLSIGWARIFFPFGPLDKPDRLLSQVIDAVGAGRRVGCSQGLQTRPFIHVTDAARAIVALLGSDVEGPVNIALDEIMSVRDLALLAAQAAGDPTLVDFGSRPLLPGEPREMRATVDRLRDEVGFVARYSIADAVASTVAERLGRDPASA